MTTQWNKSQRTIPHSTFSNLSEHNGNKVQSQSRRDGWRTPKSASCDTVDGFSNCLAAAIARSTTYNLLSDDDIKSYDPAAIVALPRLALLVAMLDHTWCTMKWEHDPRWILTKREEKESISSGKHWFRNKEHQMQALALHCQDMSINARLQMEQSLINGQGGEIFKQICALADNLMISSSSFCKMLQTSIDQWKSKKSEEEVESLFI